VGPLFSLGLLVILGGLAMSVLFAISRLFLPTRWALALAMLLVVAGGAGCIIGLLIQIPFLGDTLSRSGHVLRYLSVILVGGGASAACALWAFLRWRKDRLRRSEARTFD
jgi:hypothetical protein